MKISFNSKFPMKLAKITHVRIVLQYCMPMNYMSIRDFHPEHDSSFSLAIIHLDANGAESDI